MAFNKMQLKRKQYGLQNVSTRSNYLHKNDNLSIVSLTKQFKLRLNSWCIRIQQPTEMN